MSRGRGYGHGHVKGIKHARCTSPPLMSRAACLLVLVAGCAPAPESPPGVAAADTGKVLPDGGTCLPCDAPPSSYCADDATRVWYAASRCDEGCTFVERVETCAL